MPVALWIRSAMSGLQWRFPLSTSDQNDGDTPKCLAARA